MSEDKAVVDHVKPLTLELSLTVNDAEKTVYAVGLTSYVSLNQVAKELRALADELEETERLGPPVKLSWFTREKNWYRYKK